MNINPSMAQLDNAADSDSEERGFESLWAGQKSNTTFVVLLFLSIERDSNPIVHLAAVRLGGDARDIQCDGSRSERTHAERESLWAGQKKRLVYTSRFFDEIRLSASEKLLRNMK